MFFLPVRKIVQFLNKKYAEILHRIFLIAFDMIYISIRTVDDHVRWILTGVFEMGFAVGFVLGLLLAGCDCLCVCSMIWWIKSSCCFVSPSLLPVLPPYNKLDCDKGRVLSKNKGKKISSVDLVLASSRPFVTGNLLVYNKNANSKRVFANASRNYGNLSLVLRLFLSEG